MIQALTHLGEIFREDFLSPFHVAENGGVITGNPVINNGYQSDGTADYVRYQKVQWSNIKDFSVWIDIEELKSVGTQAFVSGDIATSPLIRLINSTTVQFFPNQSSFVVSRTIPEASVGDTLKLGVSYNSATLEVNFYLNGSKLGALTAAGGFHSNPGSLELFARLGALDISDAAANRVSIYNRILTDDDFAELYDGTFGVVPNPIRHFAMQDKIGSSAPFTTSDTTGRSSAVLGDGSTSSTFPTKLTNTNGYSFDGGDYLDVELSPYSAHNATEISLCTWIHVNTDDISGVYTVIADTAAASTSVNDGFIMYIDDRGGAATNAITFSVHTTSNGARGVLGSIDSIKNGYNFIVGTYNANDFAKVYVNGQDVTSSTQGSATGDFVPNSSSSMMIGARVGPGNYFVGDINKVFGYDKTLSLHEVKYLFSKGPEYLGRK